VSHTLTVSRERTTGQYLYKYCSHDVAKYPQPINIRQIHQLWERSFTIIISTILRPLKQVPQMVRMTPLRFFALCLLYSSPAQALVASEDHCQHMREDNC